MRVLIADDHPLFRDAMRLAIGELGVAGECLEASALEEVHRLLEAVPDLDLLLLDLRMPGMDGFAGLVELRRRFPHVPVVIVSAVEEPYAMREALACGAMGYIPKSLDRRTIAAALHRVLEGEIWLPVPPEELRGATAPSIAEKVASLTPQQLRVLRLMVEGKPNKIIAYELDIAETTVKAHITVILRKLEVHSRTQAVLAARDFFAPAA